MPSKGASVPRNAPPSSPKQGAAPPAASSLGTRRPRMPLVYTLAFAAVTIMGTYYGAGLKMQQEHESTQKKQSEVPVEQMMDMLLARRRELLRSRHDVELKLQRLEDRVSGS